MHVAMQTQAKDEQANKSASISNPLPLQRHTRTTR